MPATWDPTGPLEAILNGEGITSKATEEAAEKVRRRTEATRRMQSAPSKYGELTVTSNPDGTARLQADGPLAHLEEWGSKNNPPYASMRRAIASEGYSFKEAGK